MQIVVIGARTAQERVLVLPGMAILAGVIRIPSGCSAGDPLGLRHALARAVGSQAAFALAPSAYHASAICALVALACAYSLAAMTRLEPVPEMGWRTHGARRLQGAKARHLRIAADVPPARAGIACAHSFPNADAPMTLP